MHPELFRIPLLDRPVPAYGMMLMVGFLLAIFFLRMRAASIGLDKGQVFDLGFCAIVGGIVGARLMHVIVFWPKYFLEKTFWPDWMGPMGWLGAIVATWNGGLVFYGGLIGGIGALWIYARCRKIPLVDILDFCAPGIALGLAMTRVGCFLNGCCYGGRSDLPWAVTYPDGSHPHEEQIARGIIQRGEHCLPVHPAQLYESLVALGLFLLLFFSYPRRRFRGQIAWSFGLLYSVWRFFNEFLRDDSGPWRPEIFGRVLDLGPLTIFQYMSILLVMIFGTLMLASWKMDLEPYRPQKPGKTDPGTGAVERSGENDDE